MLLRSEQGRRGVVGRGREETPLRLMFRVRVGCGGGSGVGGGFLYELER